MSKVIKAAVWEENPHLIEVPVPPRSTKDSEVAEEPLSEEAVQDILARIAYREQEIQDKLRDADIQASIIRQAAETQREELLNDARALIEEMKQQGYKDGHAEGMLEGRAEGELRIREELAELVRVTNNKSENTLRATEVAVMEYLDRAEAEIVEIAMMAVERVLPQHFIDVPQMVLPVVRDALAKVKDQKRVIIHVHPDSYEFVLLGRDELRNVLTAGDAVVEITSDESLKVGDCLIETPSGGVDARLAVQIEALKQAVREVMK